MNIHTWIQADGYLVYLASNLAMFVIRPSRSWKTLQLFPSSIYWFLLCMEMALEDLHIYQSFSNQNTYTYACMHKKSFSSAHFPTFTLHQTKAWKLSTFYAYIECTSMHRMRICAEKQFWFRTKDSIFLRQPNIQKKKKYIEIGLCKLFTTPR